jgi:hypothetical protein
MQTAPLPWTIESDGPTLLIRDANGKIVAEVIARPVAEQIVASVHISLTGEATTPPPPPHQS